MVIVEVKRKLSEKNPRSYPAKSNLISSRTAPPPTVQYSTVMYNKD
jgi:hypothetical protein